MEVPSLCKHESRRLEEIIMPPASFSEGNFQNQWWAETVTFCLGMPSCCCRCNLSLASESLAVSETEEHTQGQFCLDVDNGEAQSELS